MQLRVLLIFMRPRFAGNVYGASTTLFPLLLFFFSFLFFFHCLRHTTFPSQLSYGAIFASSLIQILESRRPWKLVRDRWEQFLGEGLTLIFSLSDRPLLNSETCQGRLAFVLMGNANIFLSVYCVIAGGARRVVCWGFGGETDLSRCGVLSVDL